ncbi:hypothetical protein HK100_006111 [Physocladia obscura]|uniref:Uncharacterized protein n=1 Tax=Physocladia obscura TaxID=109957 RepID=A0AAD5T656_9FUNG|nr:hypothetical protein HK100_006111 [Physocladia obscura]
MEVSSKNNESIVSERVQEQHPTREDYNVPRIPLSMASLPLKQGKSPAPARKEYGYALTSSSGSNSRSSSADSKRSGSKLLGRAGSSSKLLSSKKDENSGGTATQIPSRGALQQPEAQLQTQTQAQEVPLRNNTTMQERLQAFQRLQSVLMAANQLAASEAAFSKQQAARTETHTAFDAALAKLFLPSALESCDGASAACDPGANGTRDVMSERDHDATATARDRLRAVAAAVASLSVSENTLNDSAARSREDAHTAFDRCLTNSLLSKDGASLPLLPVLDSATYSSNLTFAEAFKGANNLISNNESEKTIATASVDREDAFRRLETVMKAVNRLSSVEAALKGHVGGNDPDVRLRVEAHCEFGRVVESLLVPGGRVLQNDAPGGCSGKNILGASFGDVCAAAAAANIKN